MGKSLSKSRIQKGLQCEKALWLKTHNPDSARPLSEAQQWVLDQGTEVGLLARELFPGGAEIAEDYLHSAQALSATARAIEGGATILYEPAFSANDVFVRADILVASGDGRWDLYEVKSGAALKDAYVRDATIQAYAVLGAGLELRSINIVRLNTSYVYGGGEYDIESLFAIDEITALAREFLPRVSEEVLRLQDVLQGPEPQVRVGAQCSHPYACEFSAYCHSFLPASLPITELPRLSESLLHALLEAGHTSLLDVPPDFPGLSIAQRQSLEAVQAGEPHVDVQGLAGALGTLRWPVYHLDFETIAPALPLWPGTRPYQTIPFQYSLHVHYADGTTKHRQYLHAGHTDPRRPLARRLIADCGRRGSVLHYTSYERTQISSLMSALPDLAPALGFISRRLVDLEPLIRANTRHPASAGRSSIKYVLPAWCPDLSYSELNIGDGQTASVRYLRVLKGLVSTAEADQVRADLEEYCALDTFAMVRLLEEMKRLARDGAAEGAAR